MPADIGDNFKTLTPAEERALFFHHYAEISAAHDKVKVAQAEEKRLRRVAKVDKIVLRDINFAMRCAEVEDQDIIVRDISQQYKIANWLGLPLGAEPELNFDREPLIDRADREGLAAGLAARPRNAPYAVDSEAGQAWLAAYDRGQAEVRDNYLSAMEKRNAERNAALAAKRKGNGHDEDETDAEYVEDETEDA